MAQSVVIIRRGEACPRPYTEKQMNYKTEPRQRRHLELDVAG